MPPSNTPRDTSPEAATATTPYLEQLAELASPVPDFAATLTTQAEQDANDDNVHFLRTPSAIPTNPSTRAPNRLPLPNPTPGAIHTLNAENDRRLRRMLEFVERRRRYTPAQLRELGELHEPSSHVNRIPEPSQYHGWASGSLGDGEGLDPDILSLARSPAAPQQDHSHHPLFRMPRTNSGSSRDSRIPQLSQASSSESLDFRSPEVNGPTFVSESSLHAAALLQSSRRNSLQHARSRSQVQTYIPSRDRSSHDGDDAERSSSTRLARGSYNFAPPSQQLQAQQRQQQQLNARSQQLAFYQMQQTNQLNYQRRFHQDQLGIHQRQMIANQRDWVQTQEANQARSTQLPVETYRQRYLENPSTTPPNPTRSLDDAIKYLERLRFCESVQDSLLSAKAGGFGQDELSSNADFILDIADIEPPPESSWLKFGAILSGSQHAANPSALPSYRALPQATNPSTVTSRASQSPVFIPQGQISGPLRAEQISRPSGANPTSLANLDVDEQWPVKVTIHSTDYATMTISGTMEAFNVPDKSSPTHESSITTFLEGEIIDFNKFTLETKSYNANSRIDGTYWRKLEPFKKLTDDEIVRALLSKKWLTEELSKKWILMRWKEKCFVTPSDAQSSLTISGFYYVSLRREDGYVEGLYYDPSSTPYQHLSLMPERRTFPAYEFQ